MAEVIRRRTGKLIPKLFEILMSHPEGLQARDALDQLRSRVQLTDYEKGVYESGASRLIRLFGSLSFALSRGPVEPFRYANLILVPAG